MRHAGLQAPAQGRTYGCDRRVYAVAPFFIVRNREEKIKAYVKEATRSRQGEREKPSTTRGRIGFVCKTKRICRPVPGGREYRFRSFQGIDAYCRDRKARGPVTRYERQANSARNPRPRASR